jgi:hypothetical protein
MKQTVTAEQFYSTFFKNGEGIGFQSRHPKDEGGWWPKNRVALQAPGMVSAINFEYNNFCINPIDPYHDNNPENLETRNKPRITLPNVTAYRGMLIECDNLSPKQQTIRMTKSKMPYSAKVFSGNNSYHYTIFFDRDLTEDEYYATFDAIKAALVKYSYVLDESCRVPVKLTRAPFCKREGNGNDQNLHEFKGIVKFTDILTWLKENRVNVNPVRKAIKEHNEEYQGPGNADEELRWNDAVSRNTYWNHDYGLSPRQPWLFELGKQCKANGLDQDVALRLAKQNFQHDQPNKIVSAITNGYTYGKLSPRTLNKPERTETTPGISLTAPKEEFDDWRNGQRPSAYESVFRVNNDFYQLLPNGEHIPKTISTLKVDFGDNAHSTLPASRKYDKFTWKPNLLKDERVIVEKEVRMFNTFISPVWKIREGVTEADIPYSLHMMRRIFHGNCEDQYEVGLDWMYKAFFDPDQNLPNPVLVGPTRTGKTEWVKHVNRIATGNMKVNLFTSDDLLGQFNSHSANTWFKGFDEVKLPKNDELSNKIKSAITADTLKVEAKGKDAFYIDNKTRLLFTTNNMMDFLQLSSTEDRYWVRQVNPPTAEDIKNYPNYVTNLKKEIPDFISYIYHRGTVLEPTGNNNDRFWFDFDMYDTEALRAVKDGGKSDLEIAIDNIVEMIFVNNPKLEIAYVRAQSVRDKIEENTRFEDRKITNSTISKILSNVALSTPTKMRRRDSLDGEELNTRFFEIKRSDIILDEVTMPNFDEFEEVKDVVVAETIVKEKTKSETMDEYLRTRKEDEFFDIFDVDVPLPTE